MVIGSHGDRAGRHAHPAIGGRNPVRDGVEKRRLARACRPHYCHHTPGGRLSRDAVQNALLVRAYIDTEVGIPHPQGVATRHAFATLDQIADAFAVDLQVQEHVAIADAARQLLLLLLRSAHRCTIALRAYIRARAVPHDDGCSHSEAGQEVGG